jgi:integrase
MKTKRDALALLNQRLAARGKGPLPRDLERVQYGDLERLILDDYTKNGRKSKDRLECSLAHLRAAFAGWRVVDLQEDAIDAYAAARLKEGAANATVNRELAALRRMLRLGRRAKLVGRVPEVSLLEENNVRTGFLEDGEFVALRDELPEHLRPLLEAGFITGWRKGELLSREWRHIDLEAGWLRLEPGETKNGKGRQFPLIPRLRVVLEAQLERKRSIERKTGRVVRAVFVNADGSPIKDFYASWRAACKEAEVPGLLFHDLRRTAARNLIRAGIPETVAMKCTGHETDSIFRRYAIVDETQLEAAGAKLQALLGGVETRAKRKVAALGGRGRNA